jgi:hypothetical protein
MTTSIVTNPDSIINLLAQSKHHRQTAPKRFRDPYIIAQQLALLAHAQKSLIISNHAADKRKSYLWSLDGTGRAIKRGQTFYISHKDIRGIKDHTLFSALLASASHENIFEIVLNTDYEVIKLALRIDLPTSPDTDIILVLGGELEPDRLEYQSVRLVTWYLNDKNDHHSTLQKERYS